MLVGVHRGEDHIPLVLPVGVVDGDHRSPGTQCRQGLRHRIQPHPEGLLHDHGHRVTSCATGAAAPALSRRQTRYHTTNPHITNNP